MTKSPSKDYHLEGVRDLACNIILQAVEDIWNKNFYQSIHQRAIIKEARRTARHFFKSRSYEQLCSIMDLPADKIKDAAFHPAKYPEIIKMLRERKKR
jgi:hypothetical protein